MSEPDYHEVEADERRRLLRSFGYWDLVALGAVVGAGFGFLFGLGDEPRRQGWSFFGGMAVGAICALVAGWATAKSRARTRFFARWAAERQWRYRASGRPFVDTLFLKRGESNKASDFFSDFWPGSGAVLYQHVQMMKGSAVEGAIINDVVLDATTYIVLHFSVARLPITLLQISPRSRSVELAEKLSARYGEIDERIELESAELDQHFRISGLRIQKDEIRRLLTPSAIVKLLDFQRAFPGGKARFEILGSNVAFLVEKKLSPEQPQLIEQLLELWRPIAFWVMREGGWSAQTPQEGQSS